MTLGSLFDGIGGWQIAAKRAGVLPIWSSEIEPFPLAVTKKRFPAMLQPTHCRGYENGGSSKCLTDMKSF